MLTGKTSENTGDYQITNSTLKPWIIVCNVEKTITAMTTLGGESLSLNLIYLSVDKIESSKY